MNEVALFELKSAIGRARRRSLERAGEAPSYLNLGANEDRDPRFCSVDFFGSGADLEADLRYPLAVRSATIAEIFAEHTLEHLTFADGLWLLRECHRVLVPGGRIRIIVPDVGIFARRYASGDAAWFATWEANVLAPRRRTLRSPIEALSFVTQEYGRKSAWDFEIARSLLTDAGFTSAKEVGFRVGTEPLVALDNPSLDRTMLSLYAEAQKPAGGAG